MKQTFALEVEAEREGMAFQHLLALVVQLSSHGRPPPLLKGK